jgi:TPP-dependent trihydroxycyclohexane-1,2-dione (THcHDO) dehydratase
MTNRTLRLATAQALVPYLSKQYSVADGERRRLIPAALGIFGHGNVAGLGQALQETRSETRPVVIVVPVIPHADLPSAGCWWDVAPAEVSESDTVRAARCQYESGLVTQRWHA